ncbi:MAG: hypothetical protein ACTSYI_02955, partial [Promethearchaeota archaeon]
MSLLHLILQLFVPPDSEPQKQLYKERLPDGTTKSVYRIIKDRSLNYVTLSKKVPIDMKDPIKLSKHTSSKDITKRNPPLKIYNEMGEVINPRHPDWGKPTNRPADIWYQEKKFERQQDELRKKHLKLLEKCAPNSSRPGIDLTTRQKYWLEKELRRNIFKHRKFASEESFQEYINLRKKKLTPKKQPPRQISKINRDKTNKQRWSPPSTTIIKNTSQKWIRDDNRRIIAKNSTQRPVNQQAWGLKDLYSLYLDIRIRNKFTPPVHSFKTLNHEDFMRKVTLNYVLFEQEIAAGEYTYLFGKLHHHDVFNDTNFKIQKEFSMDTEYRTKQFFSFASPDWILRFHIPLNHPIMIDHSITINYFHDHADGDPFMLTYFSPLHVGFRQGWNAIKIPPKLDMSSAEMLNVVPVMIQFLRDMEIPFKIYPCSILQAVQPEARYSKEEVAERKAEYEKKYINWELIKIESTRLYTKLLTSMVHTLTNQPD